MTVYLSTVRRRRHLSSTDVYGQASSTIQSGMSSGAFAQSNPAIVKLTYLNDGTTTGGNNTSTTSLPPLTGSNDGSTTITLNNSTGNKKDSSLTPVAWALLGVFGGIFALAILALTYLKRGREEEPKNFPVVNESLDDTTIVSSSTTRVVSLLTPKNSRGGGVVLSDAASVDEDRRRKSRSWG
jgi:hypothetical protein